MLQTLSACVLCRLSFESRCRVAASPRLTVQTGFPSPQGQTFVVGFFGAAAGNPRLRCIVRGGCATAPLRVLALGRTDHGTACEFYSGKGSEAVPNDVAVQW